MTKWILNMVWLFYILSCKNINQESSILKFSHNKAFETFKKTKMQSSMLDTTIVYSIDELSSEGSEVIANYVADTLKNAKWTIFGETGQLVFKYTFLSVGIIKVVEINYKYKSDLTHVNSENDIILVSSIQYDLDIMGKLISKSNGSELTNLFLEFKKNVPFILSGNKN